MMLLTEEKHCLCSSSVHGSRGCWGERDFLFSIGRKGMFKFYIIFYTLLIFNSIQNLFLFVRSNKKLVCRYLLILINVFIFSLIYIIYIKFILFYICIFFFFWRKKNGTILTTAMSPQKHKVYSRDHPKITKYLITKQ